MERRLAEIPTGGMGRRPGRHHPDAKYVLDYLAHSFPVQLYEPFTDSEGNLCSRPVYRDGQPVESREAVARRDRLIEKLASLSPVPGALDQIVQRFGCDMVAESPAVRAASSARAIICWSKPVPVRPTSPRPRPSWMTQAYSSCSPTPGAPGGAIIAELSPRNRRLPGSLFTRSRVGRRNAAIQASAARTGPTRRSRRCSGRLRRTLRQRSASVHDRSPARYALRHHARSAPDRRPGACSGPRTISKASRP